MILKLNLNLPGAEDVVTLEAVPRVNCVPVAATVVLAFSVVPSENGEADVVVTVVEEPKERFNGAFDVVLLPSEKPKSITNKVIYSKHFLLIF